MNLVEVEWLDAACENQLNLSAEDAQKLHPMARKNTGYLIYKDKEKLIMCFGYMEDVDRHSGIYETTLVIPRSVVTNIRKLQGLDQLKIERRSND